jgi:hypothetical protein
LEYYVLHKAKPVNHFIIAEELRTVTEVLGNSYDKLKQLASNASLRKVQLIVFNLSSEVYKYYLESVIQVQILEKKLFYPFRIESYPDEFYVVNFSAEVKKDNTADIFSQCEMIMIEIQKTYKEVLSNSFISHDQKKQLQQQLNDLHKCFGKFQIKSSLNEFAYGETT